MIEIKEKDIAIVEDDGDFYMAGKLISICRRDNDGFDYDKCNQLKKQILQDHEDAKGWEENMKLLSRNINDDLKQAKKDRQIVKILDERIEQLKSIDRDDYTNGAVELQKIRDGKK